MTETFGRYDYFQNPCSRKYPHNPNQPNDVIFINASGPEHFVKGNRQNQLTPEHIAKIIDTYQFQKEEPRYARQVEMEELEKNDFNLNISRYISTAVDEAEISLEKTNTAMIEIESAVRETAKRHNEFLKELGLPQLPMRSLNRCISSN